MKALNELGISPAPWSLLDDGTTVVTRVNAAEGVYGEVAVCDGGEADEANARLIAAAPEMYAALREAVAEACHGCQDTNIKHCRGKCYVARWRDALAKAGGSEVVQ